MEPTIVSYLSNSSRTANTRLSVASHSPPASEPPSSDTEGERVRYATATTRALPRCPRHRGHASAKAQRRTKNRIPYLFHNNNEMTGSPHSRVHTRLLPRLHFPLTATTGSHDAFLALSTTTRQGLCNNATARYATRVHYLRASPLTPHKRSVAHDALKTRPHARSGALQ
jgi:hypothetical protein